MKYNDIVEFWKSQNITNEAELSAALHSYGVNFAYNSGKIENDKITYYDTREVFEKDGVSSFSGDTRTLFEIQNSKYAFEMILKAYENRQEVTEDFLKEIQKTLTQGTYDKRRMDLGERPGEYKRGDYVTGRYDVGALAEDVPDEISELLEDMVSVKDSQALIAAAYFHAKFENIHPFSDGNGRTGRLLMNYFMLLHNHPPVVIHEEDRIEYYKALEHFDVNIDVQPLVDFLKVQLEKTWSRTLTREFNNNKKDVSLEDIIKKAKETAENPPNNKEDYDDFIH